jgi:hypothetical protein
VPLDVWYWQWFKRTPPQPVPLYLQLSARAKGWIVGLILAVATCISAVYAYFDSYEVASKLFVGIFVITFMSLFFVATLIFSIWRHISAATHSTTTH